MIEFQYAIDWGFLRIKPKTRNTCLGLKNKSINNVVTKFRFPKQKKAM